MPQVVRKRRSSRGKRTRGVVAAVVLCSAMSCVAPVLYASDCSRWVAEYKQGILQKRAARRLQAAKYQLTVLMAPKRPVHHYPMRKPMGPLEALRRFQIDCGDLESPSLAPQLPSLPLLPKPLLVEFPDAPPPDLPLPALTQVAEVVPPLESVPVTNSPSEYINAPSPVPEPASLLLVLTGGSLALLGVRRPARRD